LIDGNCVLINGLPAKKHEKPKSGDEISIHFLPIPKPDLNPQEIPLDIIYEDEHLIAINKPAGMVVHPAPGHFSNTFANALLFHCKNLSDNPFDPLRPGIVHRLDKDTSGILLGAKTYETHQKLTDQFAERAIKKTYLAICVGVPKEGMISAPIKRHPVRRKEMSVSEEGKPASSIIKVLSKQKDLSVVQIEPITGRTHQIRVHLKHLGAPVLGDPVYGAPGSNKKYNVQRQLLHAYLMDFFHPITHKPLRIKAALPEDFSSFLIFSNPIIS
jgi:23S rRNA pseudouridine1911/1915/1917 synthase